MTPSPLLPEIPELHATGSVAEIYADIREVTGLPLVNLIYRYLASEPGRLEAVWQELRPNLVDQKTIDAAERIATSSRPGAGVEAASRPDAGGPGPAAKAPELDGSELARARATLRAYDEGNSRNLIAVWALLLGSPGMGKRSVSRRQTAAINADAILPIAALEDLDGSSLRLLEKMAAALTAPGETLLVPGLLRHFGRNADLLAYFWAVIEPRVDDGSLAVRAHELEALARSAVSSLPARVSAVAESDVRPVLERFALTIPRMLVVGGILQASLEPASRQV